MRIKISYIIQVFILFFPTKPTLAQMKSHHHYQCTPVTRSNLNTAGIWIGLKSGFSFNQVKENSFFKSDESIQHNSKTQSASNNLPFHIEVTRQFNNKFSGTISAIFIPEHNIRLIAEEYEDAAHATYYLNTGVSSYGIMGRLNYELYKYDNLSQYITAGTGAMLNTISNAELFIDYHGKLLQRNRTIVLLNNNKINLAWQFGTGIKYSVNKNLSLEIGYLYIDRGKALTKHAIDRNWMIRGETKPKLLRRGGSGEIISPKLISHQVLFGLEFKS